VIFSDDFSGDATVDLNGTTPDVTTGGATWVASLDYKADGSFADTAEGSMSLAFTPVDGKVYTLDATLENLNGSHWAQFGFGNGQEPNWAGWAWHLLRTTEDGNPHSAYANGWGSGEPWSDLGMLRYDEPMDVRIVLDTTGGTGNWLARWYAKADSDLDYTEVRAETPLTAEDIDSVGVDVFNSGRGGKLNSFSLSDAITDPNAPTVLAGDDKVTWSGELVQLAPDVTNNDTEVPPRDLTYHWTANPDDGVEFSDPNIEAPTVTITKATDNPSVVTLTLAVTLTDSDSGPVVDTMTIDAYDDPCLAALGLGLAEIDPGDFDEDCDTDFEDYAILAEKWLVNYELSAPFPKP
jgi:hypothetical protein